MSKETIYKLKISDVKYQTCVEYELGTIRKLFGEIEIVKVRQCLGGTSMKIWFKVKRGEE